MFVLVDEIYNNTSSFRIGENMNIITTQQILAEWVNKGQMPIDFQFADI